MKRAVDRLMYNEIPIRDYLDKNIQTPSGGDDQFFVYVMGPYTAFDITYARNCNGKPEYIDDPLFEPSNHSNHPSRSGYEAALADLCKQVREELGARAFIATEANIPTPSQAAQAEIGLTPLTQSLYLAAASDAVAFIYSHAALNAGVGTEMGAVLSEFNLRPRDGAIEAKARRRFHIFHTERFGSATVNTAPADYVIDQSGFSTRQELINQFSGFLDSVAYGLSDSVPIWNGPSGF